MSGHERELHVSTVTIGELRRGVELLADGRRKTAPRVWLSGLCGRMNGPVLSFSTATARVWGQLTAAWEKKGITAPSPNSRIAAIAHRRGLTLVTRNTADLERTGVRLLNPFEEDPGAAS